MCVCESDAMNLLASFCLCLVFGRIFPSGKSPASVSPREGVPCRMTTTAAAAVGVTRKRQACGGSGRTEPLWLAACCPMLGWFVVCVSV